MRKTLRLLVEVTVEAPEGDELTSEALADEFRDDIIDSFAANLTQEVVIAGVWAHEVCDG